MGTKMLNKYLYTTAFALFLIPTVAWGSSTVRTGEMISVSPDQIVEDDFYGMGNSVLVSGEVVGDLLVGSAELTVNGKVGSDLTVASARVDIHGTVNDDVRILAGEVLVAGEVKGDLVVVAKALKVLDSAKIEGDILFFGTDADISGVVGGNIFGNTKEKIRVDGEVKGDIDIKTLALTLGDKANIGGGVKYTSLNELTRAQNAHVNKDIVRNDPISDVEGSNIIKNILILFFILGFSSLVTYLFFPGFMRKVIVNTRTHLLRNTIIGFAVLFLMPIAASILIISILGGLLGGILLMVYFLLLIASIILMGATAGSFIARTTANNYGDVPILFVLLGAFSLIALLFIPIVGPIIFVGLLLMTLGSLTVNIYRFLRNS